MQITTNDIKNWLKSSGHSREWLAGQLLVTKSTINSWLANVHPIPHIKLQYIKNLMHPHSTSRDLRYDDILTVTVRFTPEEWAAMLPPEIDPTDQIAAEKYIRQRLDKIIQNSPSLPPINN